MIKKRTNINPSMENRKEYIDKMVIKLTVLESKIQKLESITDEVLNDVKLKYQQQIKVLYQKKEAVQQELLKIQEIGDSV
jgi:hypothetical protein